MKHCQLAGAFALAALPLLLILPGCSGGNGISPLKTQATPTSTPTATPTTTATQEPNAEGTVLIVPSSDANFGSGTFTLTNISFDFQDDQFIVTATDTLSRTITLSVPASSDPSGLVPVQTGQTFDLSSFDALLTIKAGQKEWGGPLASTGSIKVLNADLNTITFQFQNVVLKPSFTTIGSSGATGTLTLNDKLIVTSTNR